jgi:hypothetical protein
MKDSNVLDRNSICDWTHGAVGNGNTVLQFVAVRCIDRSAVAFLRISLPDICVFSKMWSWDSVVGVATSCKLGGLGLESRQM